MLKFYRTSDCPRCRHIQDALEDLNIVHEVILTERPESVADLPKGTELPVLSDERKLFEGSEAILKHLEELEESEGDWYKFQSDSCYCDDQGEIE